MAVGLLVQIVLFVLKDSGQAGSRMCVYSFMVLVEGVLPINGSSVLELGGTLPCR